VSPRVVVTVWLGVVAVLPFACFSGDDSGNPDASGDATVDATSDGACGAFGCDEIVIINPFDSDASLGLRARALLDQTCSGGPERGCHSEFAGNTTLTLDPTAPMYSTYGIINIPSSELPDVLRVEPFHPESSYLYWKVSGDPRILDGSLIMPAVDPTTSGTVNPQIVGLIGPWIEAGAP
jgi:hypothetical protein